MFYFWQNNVQSDDDRQHVVVNRPPLRRPFWRRNYWDPPSHSGSYNRGPPRGSRSEQMSYSIDEMIHPRDDLSVINYRQAPSHARQQPHPQQYYYYYYPPPRRNFIPVQGVRPSGDNVPQLPPMKRLPPPQYRMRRPRVPRRGQMAIRRENSLVQARNGDESHEDSSPEPTASETVQVRACQSFSDLMNEFKVSNTNYLIVNILVTVYDINLFKRLTDFINAFTLLLTGLME